MTLFFIKRSRLVWIQFTLDQPTTIRNPDEFVWFSNGASLECFIKKRVIKNILFVTKPSRLAPFEIRTRRPDFESLENQTNQQLDKN
jgi:hypothetical protein